MSTQTTFAVVVTSYNYRDFLVEAVDSALSQSRAPLQVIVVDDGSTDGSPQLLKDHYGGDSRVELVCGPNGGQLSAFRRGLEHVRADVVCFLDADDRWESGYLARIGALYDARRDIDFVFSDIQLFGNEHSRIAYARQAQDLGFTAISTYVYGYWYGAPTSAISLRTTWARRCLDLPADAMAHWRLSADNCLVFGASVLGARKYFLPTGQVGYRIHGHNGWWSQRGPVNTYLNRLRSRALINHYAQVAGLDPLAIDLARFEFKTKPHPDWAEIKRYAGLLWQAPGPWWKRAERALRVLSTPLRRRRA
ncbi:MAG TPA: glycosyltransferase family A protein [Lysobacter sp.]|nr:glycosyltransferase family A protein [Lysobacter sp.]